MMNFDILKKLRPDYCIELDQQSKVLSIDNELLKQVNPHPQIIPTFDIPINDFFLQFNKNQLSNYYPDEFINNMSFFIANKGPVHTEGSFFDFYFIKKSAQHFFQFFHIILFMKRFATRASTA